MVSNTDTAARRPHLAATVAAVAAVCISNRACFHSTSERGYADSCTTVLLQAEPIIAMCRCTAVVNPAIQQATASHSISFNAYRLRHAHAIGIGIAGSMQGHCDLHFSSGIIPELRTSGQGHDSLDMCINSIQQLAVKLLNAHCKSTPVQSFCHRLLSSDYCSSNNSTSSSISELTTASATAIAIAASSINTISISSQQTRTMPAQMELAACSCYVMQARCERCSNSSSSSGSNSSSNSGKVAIIACDITMSKGGDWLASLMCTSDKGVIARCTCVGNSDASAMHLLDCTAAARAHCTVNFKCEVGRTGLSTVHNAAAVPTCNQSGAVCAISYFRTASDSSFTTCCTSLRAQEAIYMGWLARSCRVLRTAATAPS
eukprot:5475-Heterococcus_DN1.PRE.5